MRPSTIAISGDFVKPPVLTHGLLEVVPGVRHGFFTREGGVSGGVYKSLNCGVGSRDDRALVFKNRSRAAAVLGVAPGRLATPYQVHGTNAVIVDTVCGGLACSSGERVAMRAGNPSRSGPSTAKPSFAATTRCR